MPESASDLAPLADERAVGAPTLLGLPPGPGSMAGLAARAWLASRVCLLLFTYFAILLLPPWARIGPGAVAPHAYTNVVIHHPGDLVLAWKQWDAAWYLDIASKGYWTAQASAFFPLYPLLVHLVSAPLGVLHLPVRSALPAAAAGMLVSGLATLVALGAMASLAWQETASRAVAWRTVVLLVSSPLAFILAAPYTEATFLALGTLALLFARRGQWGAAGMAAFLAGLTRSTGLILVAPLVWEFGRQHGWWAAAAWRAGRWRTRGRLAEVARGTLVAASVPLALLVYMAYLWRRFGHPLAFVTAEGAWSRRLTPPWHTVQLLVEHLAAYPPGGYFEQVILLNVVMLLGFATLTAVTARRLPFSYTLYMAGLVLLSIATPAVKGFEVIVSTDRFLLAGFPAYLSAALLLERRPGMELLAVGGGFMVQAVLAGFFLTGGWVA